jgi:hypothetical protein
MRKIGLLIVLVPYQTDLVCLGFMISFACLIASSVKIAKTEQASPSNVVFEKDRYSFPASF